MLPLYTSNKKHTLQVDGKKEDLFASKDAGTGQSQEVVTDWGLTPITSYDAQPDSDGCF